ncbi:unnamed protein product [Orchesella dallaii]|uniref:Uncharacterized protein n=1 Tax=Orchesella dallaii TaxID=48710 RepID=A0ABP1QKC0_9HEXA
MASSSGSTPNSDRQAHSPPPIIFGTLNGIPQPNYGARPPPPRIAIKEEPDEYIPNVPESYYDLRSAGQSEDRITSYLTYPLLSRQQSYQAVIRNGPPINLAGVTSNQISSVHFNQGFRECSHVDWDNEDEHPPRHPLSSTAAALDYDAPGTETSPRDVSYAPPPYRYSPMQATTRGQPRYRFQPPAVHASSGGLYRHRYQPPPIQVTTGGQLQHQGHLMHQGYLQQRSQQPPPIQAGTGGHLEHRGHLQHRYPPPLMRAAARRQLQCPYQGLPIQITSTAQQYHQNHHLPLQIVPPAQSGQNSIYPPNNVNSFEQLRNYIQMINNNQRISNQRFYEWKQAMIIRGLPSYLIQEQESQNQLKMMFVSRMNSSYVEELNSRRQILQECRQLRRGIPATAEANLTDSLAMGAEPPTSVSSIACTHMSSGGLVEVVRKPPPTPIPQAIPSTSAACAGNQNEANVGANATVVTDSGRQSGTTFTLNDAIIAGGYDEQAALRKLETGDSPVSSLVVWGFEFLPTSATPFPGFWRLENRKSGNF